MRKESTSKSINKYTFVEWQRSQSVTVAIDLHLRNRKLVPCSIYRNTKVGRNRNAMGTRADRRVFPRHFSFSQTCDRLLSNHYIIRSRFPWSRDSWRGRSQKIPHAKKENNSFTINIKTMVNSLCTRLHFVNSSRWFCFFAELLNHHFKTITARIFFGPFSKSFCDETIIICSSLHLTPLFLHSLH